MKMNKFNFNILVVILLWVSTVRKWLLQLGKTISFNADWSFFLNYRKPRDFKFGYILRKTRNKYKI